MEQGLEAIENEYSLKGTHLHRLIAGAISAAIKSEPQFSVKSFEEKTIVSNCINFINGIVEGEYAIYPEKRLSYKTKNGTLLFYGTPNLIVLNGDGSVVIIDWQTGWRTPYRVDVNNKMKAYALAAMQEFNVESVQACIYSPIVNRSSSCVFGDEDQMEKEILDIIAACKVENPQFVPGKKQCHYCLGSLHGTCRHREGLSIFYRLFVDKSDQNNDENTNAYGCLFFIVIAVIIFIIWLLFGH